MRGLRRLLGLARLANRPDAPPADELAEMSRAHLLSRRDCLKAAGSVLVTGVMPARAAKRPARPLAPARGSRNVNTPRIAVVGAGIAGLYATYLLRLTGLRAQLYSADTRVGGRIVTATSLLAPGLTTEFGGEFIDSDHVDMLSLAHHFGLELIDLDLDPLAEAYFFNGTHYSEAQVIAAFQPLAARIDVDLREVPDDLSYKRFTPQALRLDRTSLQQYLERAGVPGFLHELLRSAYIDEEGQDIDKQTCLNLVTFINTDTSKGFQIFGDSDERFKIRGGSQRVVEALAAQVSDQILLGHRLEAIRGRGPGFDLVFATPSGPTRQVAADIVILALPFSTLRHVDMRVDLPPVKRKAIQELDYGTNVKIMFGVHHASGAARATTATPTPTRRSSRASTAAPPARRSRRVHLVSRRPGRRGQRRGHGRRATRALPAGGRPAVSRRGRESNGQVARAYWPGDPFVLGSYSTYGIGQTTSIGGAQFFPVGNLHFAGEHCGHPDLGYMDGAARTGRLAALGVLASIRR